MNDFVGYQRLLGYLIDYFYRLDAMSIDSDIFLTGRILNIGFFLFV
jgi:hypothetical protein